LPEENTGLEVAAWKWLLAVLFVGASAFCSGTETALTAHLVMPHGHPGDAFLEHTAHELERRFGISHATLQIEHGDAGPCKLEEHHVV